MDFHEYNKGQDLAHSNYRWDTNTVTVGIRHPFERSWTSLLLCWGQHVFLPLQFLRSNGENHSYRLHKPESGIVMEHMECHRYGI